MLLLFVYQKSSNVFHGKLHLRIKLQNEKTCILKCYKQSISRKTNEGVKALIRYQYHTENKLDALTLKVGVWLHKDFRVH